MKVFLHLLSLLVILPFCQAEAQRSVEPDPFTWIAIDDNGNTIDPDKYRDVPKEKKQVGIFYFIWHGCHGYDVPTNHDDVVPPRAKDKKSPYNLQDIVNANPDNPEYGPWNVMHHWGEPYLGYYVMNDEWVIRKHAQLLSDAGVDVIFLDVTNGIAYIPVVKRICETYIKMRKEGSNTPQFAFLMNGNADNVFSDCYDEIYGQGLYKELWYKWDGKPLVLCDPDSIRNPEKKNFTFRHSWFMENIERADRWFGKGRSRGEDKWPWGSRYPQEPGLHKGKVEFCCAAPATHPVANIGRSFDVTTNSEPEVPQPGKGIFFRAQFERALSFDPSFLFFTGWNEWTAQRQIAKRKNEAGFLGHITDIGETYFVDQYTHEFSRDIEPLNGDFGDNYYYMMADFIRQYKGVKPLPTYSDYNKIRIDGTFRDWKKVEAVYADYRGDTFHRNHYGWGSVGKYVNETGRNDIILSKVTNDGENLYFYVATDSKLSPCTDHQWMQLFIHVDGAKSWEGFDFAINRKGISDGKTLLEKSEGGWTWTEIQEVKMQADGKEIEIAVPLKVLGITDPSQFTVDFKWIDNAASDGNIQTCMRDGDSAPDGRFRYRYKFSKK